MMYSHDTNLIVFNKKIKIGCPEYSLSLSPTPYIIFLPYSPTNPQSGRYMCITLSHFSQTTEQIQENKKIRV